MRADTTTLPREEAERIARAYGVVCHPDHPIMICARGESGMRYNEHWKVLNDLGRNRAIRARRFRLAEQKRAQA